MQNTDITKQQELQQLADNIREYLKKSENIAIIRKIIVRDGYIEVFVKTIEFKHLLRYSAKDENGFAAFINTNAKISLGNILKNKINEDMTFQIIRVNIQNIIGFIEYVALLYNNLKKAEERLKRQQELRQERLAQLKRDQEIEAIIQRAKLLSENGERIKQKILAKKVDQKLSENSNDIDRKMNANFQLRLARKGINKTNNLKSLPEENN